MSTIAYNLLMSLLGFIDIYVYYRILDNRLTCRISNRFLFPTYTLIYFVMLLSAFLPELLPGMPLKMPLMLIQYTIMFLLYKDSAYKKILWIAISFFTIVICELSTMFLTVLVTKCDIQDLTLASFTQMFATILSRIIVLIIVTLLLRTKIVIYDSFQKSFFIIICIDVVYFFIIFTLFYYNNMFLPTDVAIALSFFVMFLISFLALYLLRKIVKNSEEIMTTNLKLKQIEMEHKQNQDMTIVVDELRTLRHDMNNHMSVLQGLLSMREYDDAKDYLSSIVSELEVANSFIFTDNKVLSVLMNHKASSARRADITFDSEIMTSITPFSDSDLCALLGNILENAIEACAGHDNPYIFFSMKKENGWLLITCDNTFTTPPIFEKGQLVTTKANKSYHGIGTKTIRSIVKKYEGTVSFTVDDMFHVRVSVSL